MCPETGRTTSNRPVLPVDRCCPDVLFESMESPPSVRALPVRCILGEGPHWDEVANVLYYVDIKGRKVHKFDPKKDAHTSATIADDTVSLVIPVKEQKDKYVISVGRRICYMVWDGISNAPTSLEDIAVVDEGEGTQDNRLNDGKADPKGRVWAGTMGIESGPNEIKRNNGSLFCIRSPREVTTHASAVTCSNGLAWTKDQKTMFYIDSFTHKVEAFDYDVQTGIPSNRRVAFDLEANGIPGFPDGMTIDTDDKLWVACFDGSRVIQVDPFTGSLLRTIHLPSPKITSVVFGGESLDELYITSASMDLSEEELAKYPTAGATYHVTGINAKGFPMNRAVL